MQQQQLPLPLEPPRLRAARRRSEVASVLTFEAVNRAKMHTEESEQREEIVYAVQQLLANERAGNRCEMCGTWVGATPSFPGRSDWLGESRWFQCRSCDTLPLFCAVCARKTHFQYDATTEAARYDVAESPPFDYGDAWAHHDLRPVPVCDPIAFARARSSRAAAVDEFARDGIVMDDTAILLQELVAFEADERASLEQQLLVRATEWGSLLTGLAVVGVSALRREEEREWAETIATAVPEGATRAVAAQTAREVLSSAQSRSVSHSEHNGRSAVMTEQMQAWDAIAQCAKTDTERVRSMAPFAVLMSDEAVARVRLQRMHEATRHSELFWTRSVLDGVIAVTTTAYGLAAAHEEYLEGLLQEHRDAATNGLAEIYAAAYMDRAIVNYLHIAATMTRGREERGRVEIKAAEHSGMLQIRRLMSLSKWQTVEAVERSRAAEAEHRAFAAIVVLQEDSFRSVTIGAWRRGHKLIMQQMQRTTRLDPHSLVSALPPNFHQHVQRLLHIIAHEAHSRFIAATSTVGGDASDDAPRGDAEVPAYLSIESSAWWMALKTCCSSLSVMSQAAAQDSLPDAASGAAPQLVVAGRSQSMFRKSAMALIGARSFLASATPSSAGASSPFASSVSGFPFMVTQELPLHPWLAQPSHRTLGLATLRQLPVDLPTAARLTPTAQALLQPQDPPTARAPSIDVLGASARMSSVRGRPRHGSFRNSRTPMARRANSSQPSRTPKRSAAKTALPTPNASHGAAARGFSPDGGSTTGTDALPTPGTAVSNSVQPPGSASSMTLTDAAATPPPGRPATGSKPSQVGFSLPPPAPDQPSEPPLRRRSSSMGGDPLTMDDSGGMRPIVSLVVGDPLDLSDDESFMESVVDASSTQPPGPADAPFDLAISVVAACTVPDSHFEVGMGALHVIEDALSYSNACGQGHALVESDRLNSRLRDLKTTQRQRMFAIVSSAINQAIEVQERQRLAARQRAATRAQGSAAWRRRKKLQVFDKTSAHEDDVHRAMGDGVSSTTGSITAHSTGKSSAGRSSSARKGRGGRSRSGEPRSDEASSHLKPIADAPVMLSPSRGRSVDEPCDEADGSADRSPSAADNQGGDDTSLAPVTVAADPSSTSTAITPASPGRLSSPSPSKQPKKAASPGLDRDRSPDVASRGPTPTRASTAFGHRRRSTSPPTLCGRASQRADTPDPGASAPEAQAPASERADLFVGPMAQRERSQRLAVRETLRLAAQGGAEGAAQAALDRAIAASVDRRLNARGSQRRR